MKYTLSEVQVFTRSSLIFAINVNDLISKTKLTYERDITLLYSNNKELLFEKVYDGSFASLEKSLIMAGY